MCALLVIVWWCPSFPSRTLRWSIHEDWWASRYLLVRDAMKQQWLGVQWWNAELLVMLYPDHCGQNCIPPLQFHWVITGVSSYLLFWSYHCRRRGRSVCGFLQRCMMLLYPCFELKNIPNHGVWHGDIDAHQPSGLIEDGGAWPVVRHHR